MDGHKNEFQKNKQCNKNSFPLLGQGSTITVKNTQYYCVSLPCDTKVTYPDVKDKNLPNLKSVGDFLDTFCATAGGAKTMGFIQSLASSVLF